MEDKSQPPRAAIETRVAKVTCLDRSGRQMHVVEVPRGTLLLHPLQGVGFVLGTCGGNGSCGSCAVELEDGRLVQSCFLTVEEDVTVRKQSP